MKGNPLSTSHEIFSHVKSLLINRNFREVGGRENDRLFSDGHGKISLRKKNDVFSLVNLNNDTSITNINLSMKDNDLDELFV